MKIPIDENIKDSELFTLLQKGNEEAFTYIYKNYHKIIYVLAFRYLKSRPMAEDIVQHVFTKLWEQRSDLSIAISLKNYLYTMARNYILNQIRNENQAIIKNYQMAQTQPEYEDNLLETIENKELMLAFSHAVNLLPEQKKRVWMMKTKKGYSNQKIAEEMNISINTVKTHYAQALKMLRVHLKKMLIIVILFILISA